MSDRHAIPSTRSRRVRIGAALGALALTVSGFALVATPAHAAPGDPFDPSSPAVYIVQGTPAQLSVARTGGDGETTFVPVGGTVPISYNALAYNTNNNYLYGIVGNTGSAATPTGSLIRIGQDGVITRVGTQTYQGTVLGAMQPGSNLLYTYVGNSGTPALQIIDVTTGVRQPLIPFTGAAVVGNDFAFHEGFLWSASQTTISRINPATGAVTNFPNTFDDGEVGTAGAAWTYGNGNLGFSYNDTGNIYQVSVGNPAGTPAFTLVSTNPGPASAQNDGAAAPGLPTDLQIAKTGPAATVPQGGTATYTLTVTNNGLGLSSGFVVNDTIPAPLTNVATTDEACTVTGNELACVGGVLPVGSSVTYTFTATVPAGVTELIENTATVTGNEEDPDPTNNTSTTQAPSSELTLLKRAGEPTDVNGDGLIAAGDTIQFEFDVTNSGDVVMTDIAISDPLVGAVTCPAEPLPVDATVTCTADAAYVITDADVENGSVDNTATATGTTPDGQTVTSNTSTTSTPTDTPSPSLSIVKSATPAEGTFAPGETVEYRFVVTNTGNVTMTDITIDETEFSGTGELSEIVCDVTTLAPTEQAICTADYTFTQADVDAESLTNSATVTGTPPPGGGTFTPPPPSTVEIPTPDAPAITIVKSADVEVVAEAGQVVTYSFLVTNTGNVTLTDVTVLETDFSGSGELSAVDCPTTTLIAGESTTCTATYTVTQADVDAADELTNVANAEGTPPGDDPVPSDPSTSTVVIERSPELSIVKTSDVEAAALGQVVTYSFLVTNTGNVTITDPVIEETEFTGTGELSEIDCPAEAAVLEPGEAVTCTATYTMTQADVDAGEVRNSATVDGTPPPGTTLTPPPPSTVTVVTDPTPAMTLAKTADVTEITRVGQVVTYSFLVTNTGNVTITDPVVTEGEFSGAGELSAIDCPAEAAVLDPAEAVTCTATYTVVAADLESDELTNSATASGTTPSGPIETTPSTWTIPVNPTTTPVPPTAPPAAGGDLPRTGGMDAGPFAVLAALLLATGGILLVRRRVVREDAS